MTKKIQETKIAGKIVQYFEDDEADWIGVEDNIKNGQERGFLYRYRTAIDVGQWWLKESGMGRKE